MSRQNHGKRVVARRSNATADRMIERMQRGLSRLLTVVGISLMATKKRAEIELEERHRAGYERKLVALGEFDAWDTVQAWPEK